jgi:hypothetical protein
MYRIRGHLFELSYDPINYHVGLFRGIDKLTQLSSLKIENFSVNCSVLVEPFGGQLFEVFRLKHKKLVVS